jgi:hypothetical protein
VRVLRLRVPFRLRSHSFRYQRIIARCTQDIESGSLGSRARVRNLTLRFPVDGNLTAKVNSVLSMATMSASRLIAVGFSAPVGSF